MLFRKKPVVIEAYQWREKGGPDKLDMEDSRHHERDWPDWLRRAGNSPADRPGAMYRKPDGTPHIRTLGGEHIVSDGDWIIRGVQGELYPCKPDIFEQTYEAVE